MRFRDPTVVDVVKEFNKLKEESSFTEYKERFEELRSVILRENPQFNETCFIYAFINGLSKELRLMIKLFKPQTLWTISTRS